MDRQTLHTRIDKTLDTLENTKSCVSNKLSILSNRIRTIVKPIRLKIQLFKTAQIIGRASLYAQALNKINNKKELTEIEQLIYDDINKIIEDRKLLND